MGKLRIKAVIDLGPIRREKREILLERAKKMYYLKTVPENLISRLKLIWNESGQTFLDENQGSSHEIIEENLVDFVLEQLEDQLPNYSDGTIDSSEFQNFFLLPRGMMYELLMRKFDEIFGEVDWDLLNADADDRGRWVRSGPTREDYEGY